LDVTLLFQHFIQLQFYREQFENTSSGASVALKDSVFDDALELLEHLVTDLLDNIVEHTLLDVKARSREYRKDR
jgi:hypothetical protein